jgi:hypothetical protein
LEVVETVSETQLAPGEPVREPPRLRATGDRVDRFAIERVLGQGGMGITYAASDPQLARTVALKLVRHRRRRRRTGAPDPRGDGDGQARAPERRRRVRRRNVRRRGVDRDGVRRRRHVRDLAARRPTRVRDVIVRYSGAARGLAAAHAAGIVHRDFKPANVLLGDDGRPRVADFGLARTTGKPVVTTASSGEEAPLPTITAEGVIAGTPAYMAPEQLDGRDADARSDQYSFCVALWEAVYGDRPERDDDARLREPADRRGVPSWLDRIVRRGLAIEPDERWPSMDALIAALEQTPRRRRLLAIAIAACAVLAIAAAIIVVAVVRAGDESRRADREADVATARSDEAALSDAQRVLPTDPTAAVEALEKLSPGSSAWPPARIVLAEAATRGVSHRLAVNGRITALAFSADGTRLAAGGTDSVVYVWDLRTWARSELVGQGEPIAALGFGPTSNELISVDKKRGVRRWDVTARTGREERPPTRTLADAAVAPGGRWVGIFSVSSELVDLAGTDRPVDAEWRHGAWSPDGAALHVFDTRRGIVRVDRDTLASTMILESSDYVYAIATDRTRTYTATMNQKSKIRETFADGYAMRPSGHAGPTSSLACTTDGTLVSASSAIPFNDTGVQGDAHLVVQRGLDLQVLTGHAGDVDAVAITASGDRVASAAGDGVRVWDRRGVRLADYNQRSVWAAMLGSSRGPTSSGRAVRASTSAIARTAPCAPCRSSRTRRTCRRRASACAIASARGSPTA